MKSGHRNSLNIWCALIGIAATGCLTESGADQDDTAATVSELSEASQAGATAPVKTVPVKPQAAPGVTTDGTLPDKPATSAAATATATDPSTVTLVASQPSPWAGAYTLLTATTNVDVGPTAYYIRIWDDDIGWYIASCGAGTTCSIAVMRPGARATSFRAEVSTSSHVSVASAFVSVYWHVSGIRLTESETTVAAGRPVMLTAFTDYNIGASPYYVQIYDDTTSTLLGRCGSGTMCSVTVSQAAATTHRYRACFSEYSTSYPPPNALECTMQKLVTWTGNHAIRVFLQAMSSDAVTAIASTDVTTTPYYIQIYNLEGDRVAVCGSGTSCAVAGTAMCGSDHLIAVVGPWSSTPITPGNPGAAQATSRVFSAGDWMGQGAVVVPCPHPGPSGRPFVPTQR